MQITVKGHNVDVTQALNDYVNDKFTKKIDRQSDGIKAIQVTLSVEKTEQKAEAVIDVVGDTFHTCLLYTSVLLSYMHFLLHQ